MKLTRLFLKLLPAVLLAAATQRSPANIVGYVNVSLAPGWNLLSTPLKYTNHNANLLLLGPPDGALLYRYDPTIQDFKEAGSYLVGVGWYPLSGDTNDAALNLPLGEGYFIWTPRWWTNTFVGEVMAGWQTNAIPANYSLKASMGPQGGLLHADLAFPNVNNDAIHRLTAIVWTGPPFDTSTYEPFIPGWFPSEPSIAVAQGFFVHRDPAQATVANWWVRNFAPRPAGTVTTPTIESFSVHDGVITLKVNKATKRYDVQFSTDRENWTTTAANQTAATWKGPVPSGPRGFFQVTQP